MLKNTCHNTLNMITFCVVGLRGASSGSWLKRKIWSGLLAPIRIQLPKWCCLFLSRIFLKIRNQLCIFRKFGHFIPVGWFLNHFEEKSNTNWNENFPCLILTEKIECVENNCQYIVQIIHIFGYTSIHMIHIRYCSLVQCWYVVFWKISL